MRWEFYVQLLIAQLSQAFTNTAFRVLFSEMVPVGYEVRWFSLQVVLSCGTVSYGTSAPGTWMADSSSSGLGQLHRQRTPAERHASAPLPAHHQSDLHAPRAGARGGAPILGRVQARSPEVGGRRQGICREQCSGERGIEQRRAGGRDGEGESLKSRSSCSGVARSDACVLLLSNIFDSTHRCRYRADIVE